MGKFLTLEEVAEQLGVEYKTVYRLVRGGELPAGKVGRIYRIREEDLEAYFDRQKERLAQQTERAGFTALEGRRCGVCDKSILSKLSVGGTCEECGLGICQACWAIRKARRCMAHAGAAAGDMSGGVQRATEERGSATDRGEDNRLAVIERLREQGLPVVTSEEARLAEEAFIRSFAQRLESVEELPDPLSRCVIPLRRARVKHDMESGERLTGGAPTVVISRFTLRYGGWGKPKAGLVLEARFMIRPEAFSLNGYDTEPLGEAELASFLHDARERASKGDCFHIVLAGSPTGWSGVATETITERHHPRAFRDQRVGIALHDLHANETHLDETDERLWAFWSLLWPARHAKEVDRCVGKLRDLVGRYECVSLEYAAQECQADSSWVRAAFEQLKRTGTFELREGSTGLVIAGRRL